MDDVDAFPSYLSLVRFLPSVALDPEYLRDCCSSSLLPCSVAACFSLWDSNESTLKGENFLGINLKDDDAGLAGNTFDDSIAIPITFVAEKEDGNIFSFIVLWGIIGGGGDNESGIGYSICPMERVRVVSKADEIKDDAETESVLSVVLCFCL